MLRNIGSLAIGILLVIAILLISNVVDLGADWLKGDRFEAEASPTAVATDTIFELVGCIEGVCTYGFAYRGHVCLLAIGERHFNATWTFALACP